MLTQRITTDISRAAEIIRGGGLAAVPTETVYGLAGNGLDAAAVEKIYAVKGRPAVKALSLLVSGPEALSEYGAEVPAAAVTLAKRFWPGPLTIILRSRKREPELVRAGGDTIGLRCPDHPLTLELLRRTGLPLAAPSANPSGADSPKDAGTVLNYFDGRIDAVIDGGVCGVGRESTILDMSRTPYRILRQGALPAEEIWRALADDLTVVGLTGGSGSGKTTALSVLEGMGALVLDADRIYHELTVSSEAMKNELTARFGEIYTDGKLDRRALADIVFRDAAALAELNDITHKYVRDEIQRRLEEHARNGGTLAAVDAIALLEGELAERCAFTVAVAAPAEHRVARLVMRDGISEAAARQRINAQKPENYFREHCDYLLRNEGDMAAFQNICTDFFTEVLNHGRGKERK